MPETALQLDPRDNVIVALSSLEPGMEAHYGAADARAACPIMQTIPAKQKMALTTFNPGDMIVMYGMVVGEVTHTIPRGGLLTTSNIRHRIGAYTTERKPAPANVPDASAWKSRTFLGYHRADGQVGTRNYWIVVPLVFCENRNVEQMREALEEELGYGHANYSYRERVRKLIEQNGNGGLSSSTLSPTSRERMGRGSSDLSQRVFPNLDGIRFLTHQLGCGGTRQDAQALCGLIAGYIHHPNVAGATVLSLGCQNAQSALLMEQLRVLDPHFDSSARKPVLIFDQQKSGTESALLNRAIDETFVALAEANRAERKPAPLSGLTVGLQCGGSDGFSGISANPTVGYVSDLVVGCGGKTVLSEFPELHGVEQALINRCVSDDLAQRFAGLMQAYAARARALQSDFAFNPSPGNIRDGLITDAIKSAGAARKGGVSPVSDVIDYPEYVRKPGLTLQCTPGNDVESVTAQVGAGCSIVLFTTGLGTPTGSPIAPVLKISTNSSTSRRMSDIIDFDAGPIVTGEASVPELGEKLLELSIQVASGERLTLSEQRGQIDFIPWKRGVSL
jgi:altronate hydrolase